MQQVVDFSDFFQKATGFRPFPYQEKMAYADEPPALVSIPTGLGKTAAVILTWLWRRRYSSKDSRDNTPRRLIYCLPMRVLVEQTRDCAEHWLKNLGVLADKAPAEHPVDKVAVHMLMGGDMERDWDSRPDRDMILIGTQDMLLSRALNRGYAASRFRWPVQFGLLNNDCLWVMDEVQLMGNGLATTAQLQAFRRKMDTVSAVRSTWMSATIKPEWLDTVDFNLKADARMEISLSSKDMDHPVAKERLSASKPISKAIDAVSKDGKAEAALILDAHKERGDLTLVVVNTVKRAMAVHAALSKSKSEADILLIHSHFRPDDRAKIIERLLARPGDAGTIAVSTQVVEAGVDVSAKTLFTDLAPWSSMVQRFGRCNRKGEHADAEIFWIDVDTNKKGAAAPYENDALDQSRERLTLLNDACLSNLPETDEGITFSHVLRGRDIVELFDTTPDLAGADIDVSRFIREADEHSVQVFWRDLEEDAPADTEPSPHRNELCSVPLGDLRSFLKNKHMWRWDHLESRWAPVQERDVFPGLVLMARCQDGGYDTLTGWNLKSKRPVDPVAMPSLRSDFNDADFDSMRDWMTLAQHTDAVVNELEKLINIVPTIKTEWQENLRLAARWHDAGKAHHVFQEAMVGDAEDRMGKGPWAKTAHRNATYKRRGFRHELASALTMLENDLPNLAVYLAAAHHGKVRLSIRSLPHESHPDDHHKRFARGIWDGDILPSADLGGGVTMPKTTMNLSYMELGEDEKTGPSWLARMIALRDELGPFKLAYLETLLRIADWRGSSIMEDKVNR